MGTLICRVELSKETGLTITANDPEGNVTQTIVMDGKSITMTVKGKKTSTITQTEEAINLKCTEFTVEAESVSVKSKKESTYESGKDHTIKGDGVSLTAQKSADISGQDVAVDAEKGVALSGMEVTAEGTQSAKMSGAMVDVEAKGQLALNANGAAELKGTATTVGGMVKLG